jgi:membrane protein implicated in regulation of membrane protease activity
VFALLAFAAIAAWRRYRRQRPEVSDQPTLNRRGAQYVGQVCEVVDPITNGSGRVRLGDTIWTVHGPDAPAGGRVRVVAVEGAVLQVVAADR